MHTPLKIEGRASTTAAMQDPFCGGVAEVCNTECYSLHLGKICTSSELAATPLLHKCEDNPVLKAISFNITAEQTLFSFLF